MKLPFYHVDAFTENLFQGNPAVVCLPERPLSEKTMQKIAKEHNLSETAFLVPQQGGWRLRWFTPEIEIDLCGHATLASAFVLFELCGVTGREVCFDTMSGRLTVRREGSLYSMDFPIRAGKPCEAPGKVVRALGAVPVCALRSRDLLLVYPSQGDIEQLAPNTALLDETGEFGIIATAPGRTCDFVSRYFAPGCGVVEDPVTGSSHCTLIPYWAKRLNKTQLTARQLSARGGELLCGIGPTHVTIAGRAVLFSRGEILLESD